MEPKPKDPKTLAGFSSLVHDLLKVATPIGAFSLGFIAASFPPSPPYPSHQTLASLANCQSLPEGLAKLEALMEWMNSVHLAAPVDALPQNTRQVRP